MAIMQFYIWLCLCLAIIICKLSAAAARPAYDDGYIVSPGSGAAERFDYDYYQPNNQALTESRLRRLRRGYYYVDDGYITAIPASSVYTPNRRQDADLYNAQYTPLVRVKQTHTKRKKLFVPNLFG